MKERLVLGSESLLPSETRKYLVVIVRELAREPLETTATSPPDAIKQALEMEEKNQVEGKFLELKKDSLYIVGRPTKAAIFDEDFNLIQEKTF